jgi:peptidoglycan/xylan/chitin deacetylase (PgdA/CDA1 family)
VRQKLQKLRNKRLEQDENWFLPIEFFANLAAALKDNPKKIVHPWPDAAPAALVLTHDVETSEGIKLIEPLARIEEELGLRSCWNLVPEKYPIDKGLVADLIDRGFELGVHGYNHDGRLFASEREFERRMPVMNEGFRRFDASGFRAPMVHRNLDWICRLDLAYDASCFDVDPFQAMPGGIGSLWPCIVNGIVELPYTMPQDHTLFTSLGHTSTYVWEKKAEFVRKRNGMALLLTHPDYLDSPKLRSLYGDFLKRALESDWWHALPRDVASWWRCRESYARGESVKDKTRFDSMSFVPATISSDGDSVDIAVLDIDRSQA